jgi:hypothetical protein
MAISGHSGKQRLAVAAGLCALSGACFGLFDPKPQDWLQDAMWGSERWGVVEAVPLAVKKGTRLRIQGVVVGGPAADPYWGCTDHGWAANGTFAIGIYMRGLNDVGSREASDPPPLGWEDRVSDTCYCTVSAWGASGSCSTREVYPALFQRRPPEASGLEAVFSSGHQAERTADPGGANYWDRISVEFSGNASVGHSARAYDTLLTIGDLSALDEDTDGDGLPDIWEVAHDPAPGVGDPLSKFTGGPTITSRLLDWLVPVAHAAVPLTSNHTERSRYAPREAGWVSRGPTDWDGDGISNQDEYAHWLNDEVDDYGYAYDPTVINVDASNRERPAPVSRPSDWMSIILQLLD